jgi:hypothetical protein
VRVNRSRATVASSPRARGAGWRTWIAALTVAVVAVAPLLGVFHRASVRHAVCEHGDLIEPEQGSGHSEARGQVEGAASIDAPLAALAGIDGRAPAALHDHAHCPVGTLARAGVAVTAPASALVSLLEVTLSEAPRPDVPFAPRAILSAAPKTSPPRPSANISA